MNRLKHTRSSLFLIELIIAILFFSAGSAVCIQAFVQAHLMSQKASDLSFASAQVSSAASVVRYTDGSPEAIAGYFPGAEEIPGAEAAADTENGGQTCAVYYDEERQLCSAEDAVYILTIHTEQEGGRTDARLSMSSAEGSSIYELSLRYPSGAAAGKEE